MNGERVTSASPLLGPQPVWRFPVARWETFEDCARALDLTDGELDWFADARSWNRRAAGPLRHYTYRWIPTSTGGIRLLEQPKPRLAELQRRVGRHVLEALPVHEAAHGFRRGRSAMTCAAPHAGRELVVRMDLEGFFPAVSARRVRSLLLLAGYAEAVAGALAGMLTTATPADVLAAAPDGRRDPSAAGRADLARGRERGHAPPRPAARRTREGPRRAVHAVRGRPDLLR
jgi:hypothetical protein